MESETRPLLAQPPPPSATLMQRLRGTEPVAYAQVCSMQETAMIFALREAAQRPYSVDSDQCQALLERLWISAFPATPFPSEGGANPASERWKRLGFQGLDPGTDFRGAGQLALEQLVAFAESMRVEEFGEFFANGSYPFAAVSVNVTETLVYHLELREPPPRVCPCCGTDKAAHQPADLVAFVALLSDALDDVGSEEGAARLVLDRLHAMHLQATHAEWRALRARRGAEALLQFRDCLRRATARLLAGLRRRPRSLDELEEAVANPAAAWRCCPCL